MPHCNEHCCGAMARVTQKQPCVRRYYCRLGDPLYGVLCLLVCALGVDMAIKFSTDFRGTAEKSSLEWLVQSIFDEAWSDLTCQSNP